MVEPKTGDFKASHKAAGDTSENGRNPAPRFKGDSCDTLKSRNQAGTLLGGEQDEIERLHRRAEEWGIA
jgi:hypothetical protein